MRISGYQLFYQELPEMERMHAGRIQKTEQKNMNGDVLRFFEFCAGRLTMTLASRYN